MSKLRLRGDAPAITRTNAEVEALVTERDKLRERLATNAHYDEKILAENLAPIVLTIDTAADGQIQYQIAPNGMFSWENHSSYQIVRVMVARRALEETK
jgi:hypothetical protein